MLGIEVVAHHQHVEMLVDGVHRVGPRRVGGGRAGRWPAPTTLMMSGAWPPPAPSVWKAWMVRPLKAAMVLSTKPDSFSVSVWIATWTSISSATREAAVDRRGRGAPVLVQLEAAGAGLDLLAQRLGQAGVALAEEAEVHRQAFGRLQHAADVPGAGRAGRGVGAGRRPGAAADQRRDAATSAPPR